MKAILKFAKEDFTYQLPMQNKEFQEALLEFDLFEEECEFKTVVNASQYSTALWDIKQLIRSELKNGSNISKEDILEKIRDLIPEIY